jgi:hypothetical protein
VLGGDPIELAAVGPSYGFKLHELESMDTNDLRRVVKGQKQEVLVTPRLTTIKTLQSFL